MGDDNSGRGGAVVAIGEAGDGDVVAVNGAEGVDVVVAGTCGELGVQLVEGCFGGGHLQREGADPADGVVRVGEGHVVDLNRGGGSGKRAGCEIMGRGEAYVVLVGSE